MRVDWRGVVVVGLLTAGAVLAGGFGPQELALVLGGAAAGVLVPSNFLGKQP